MEWVVQKNPGLEGIKIDYSYELISGNITRVSYRKGYEDQLFTEYVYDRDNRLKKVKTSRDTVIWDNDITYYYYKHGLLKRFVLGEDSIQGVDYTYTIHGWLKSINHPLTTLDPGNDGVGTSATTVGKDVFGLTLNYYNNDYTGYNNNYSANNTTGIKPVTTSLYDGNISSVSYRITQTSGANNDYYMNDVNADNYLYDKLGRLREDIFYRRNGTNYERGSGLVKPYDSYYKYDQNGNVKKISRNSLYSNSGTIGSKKIDSLTFFYGENTAVSGENNSESTNTLNHVTDAVTGATNGVNDLVTQPLNTYTYDESGNLKRDNENQIDYIWNSNGKIYEVKRTTGANQFTIRFDYDAQGHKIRKQTLNGSGVVQKTTYYVYDAGGSLQAVYTKNGENGQVNLQEAPINAPGRIGMWQFGTNEVAHTNTALGSVQLYSRKINKKVYEITDQTGNVRAVVGDNKTVSGGEVIPKILMSSNYYPYGMAQAGRVISEGNDYRYGYNGMEEEDKCEQVSAEIASTGDKAKPGEGNLLNTEFRLYDPRLAQWLTRDPIFQPWESPYVSMGGNPILMADPMGLDDEPEAQKGSESNPYVTDEVTVTAPPLQLTNSLQSDIVNAQSERGYDGWNYVNWMGNDVRYSGASGNYRFEYYNNSEVRYKQFTPYTDKEYSQLRISIGNNIADSGPYLLAGTMVAPFVVLPVAKGVIAAAPMIGRAALPYITSAYIGMSNPATKEFIVDVGFSIVSGYDGPGVSSPIASSIASTPYKGAQGAIVVTEEIIAKALAGSTMKTIQTNGVSLPVVQRYVNMLQKNSVAPAIHVVDDIIVNGNHRYVAGRVFGVEPELIEWNLANSQREYAFPIKNIKVDPLDWGAH